MSQRSDQRRESRTRILRAAAKLVRAKGLAGTSVERAMRGARLTVGGFYAHFRNKHELLSRAFEEAMSEMDGVLRDAATGRTGREALVAVSAAYLSTEHLERAESGCPLPAVAGEAASGGEEKVHRMVASGIATLRGRLVAASSGEIDHGTALAMCGLLVGGQILARATRGTELPAEILVACRAAARRLARGGEAG